MSKIAARVAADHLKSQGNVAEANHIVRRFAKVPLSGPGKEMFKKSVKKLDEALDEEDHVGFAKNLQGLYDSWKKLNPEGLLQSDGKASGTSGGQVSKLPKSDISMDMFSEMVKNLNEAWEDGDADAFGKAVEALHKNHERLNA